MINVLGRNYGASPEVMLVYFSVYKKYFTEFFELFL